MFRIKFSSRRAPDTFNCLRSYFNENTFHLLHCWSKTNWFGFNSTVLKSSRFLFIISSDFLSIASIFLSTTLFVLLLLYCIDNNFCDRIQLKSPTSRFRHSFSKVLQLASTWLRNDVCYFTSWWLNSFHLSK